MMAEKGKIEVVRHPIEMGAINNIRKDNNFTAIH